MNVARVVPDVSGLDKAFDYLVPDDLRVGNGAGNGAGAGTEVGVGTLVRIDLQGRRVGGWVVDLDPDDGPSAEQLKPIARVTGRGPDAEMVTLTRWAAHRWAGRWRHFLRAASPPRAVVGLPGNRRARPTVEPRSPATTALLADGGGVLRLPPTSDPYPALASAVAAGPTLAIVPHPATAQLLAARLRRGGVSVAVMPDEWAAAAAGVDLVIGGRSAVWAPVPDLAAVVVIDEHDEALQQEGSPTWHARDVALERCGRAGAAPVLISPCPTVSALAGRNLIRPPVERERAGWPIVDVIDRRDDEPWKRSLVTSELIAHLRDPERTVVCVSNTTGRARLLACRACRELARCERCDAAVGLADDGRLTCQRCGMARPGVCRECGAGRFANLRPGVTRLREELEAAANRPAVLVTADAADAGPVPVAGVYVGTEAVLHRVERADTVAFLDLDRELLAPRYRAAEQALALIVRAARLVGPRARGGRILLQTFLPDHEVVRAALLADPGRVAAAERERRELLALPPFGALAAISGAGSDAFVASLAPLPDGVMVVGDDGDHVARAPDWTTLADALARGQRPSGTRLRIAVDPPR